jgi:hypothetical protein
VAESSGSRLPDVQNGVRAIAGVVSADVRWPEPDGPATLYVVFAADLDSAGRAQVTRDVMDVLGELGGVDLGTLRARPTEALDVTLCHIGPLPAEDPQPAPRLSPATPPVVEALAEPVAAVRPVRAVFTGLNIDHHDLDIEVSVQLVLGGHSLAGQAKGIATAGAELRTVAAATLDALRATVQEQVRLELEWVRVTEHAALSVVECAVTVLVGRTEDRLYLGSVLARGDLREAVVRATLDALNRPLSRIAAAA